MLPWTTTYLTQALSVAKHRNAAAND
ncbi:hypothetical protein CGLO_09411 [Colletotrichum gloeosporioides Cg-14]|uniref:Uncharacterized protein n=1 Tax=Colletotrichum gloeosporioides (strain Cg-14) TaxID=1237896 RepID=T0KG63_COLGC|nr:hypothetical protein CGLO_09411 [Colletotrichum gloeosporioides Cg-14]